MERDQNLAIAWSPNTFQITHRPKFVMAISWPSKGDEQQTWYFLYIFMGMNMVEFGEIPKFSRVAEQAGELNNKYTVNCIFTQ